MFLTMSWFWRGFQSAIFYYVSCAPCSKLAYRRKQRKEYKRAKAEKALYEAESGLYTHPSPFNTNPYWKEEIELGPGPPERKAVRDGRGKPEKGKPRKSASSRQLRTGGVGSSTGTGVSSADTVIGSEGAEKVRNSDDGWNKKRYQREDEILWGLESQASDSTGMVPVPRSASGSRYQYYARNPAINDLHPPVVSTHPTNRNETKWMLQPPPRAKVMAGKERADISNRSRSGSGGSYGSKSSKEKALDISLGRQVGERLVESKLQRGGLPPSPTAMSRGPSARSNISMRSITVPGQPHDRDPKMLSPSKSESLKRKQPSPPSLSISTSAEPTLLSLPLPRPPLSTIPSSSVPQKPKDRPPHLPPLVLSTNSVSSLHMLQELVAPASKLNRSSPPLPEEAVKVKLPPVSHQEDTDLSLPEVESWFPDSTLGFPGQRQESHGHAHRWSMDI